MGKELMLFKNEKFGNVRMVKVDGKPYAIANDVAVALGYKKPNNAINAHCKHATLYQGSDSLGRSNSYNIISEGDIIRLAVKCPLDGADEFESWIFDIVIPSVLNNGGYISEDATLQQRQKLVSKPLSMRGITKSIHSCDVMQLEQMVTDILVINCSTGKRDRVDNQLKDLNATEYKQHVRQHIRYAIETKPYSDDRASHALEIAIRDKVIIDLLDNVLETNNRSFGQMLS